MRGHKPWNRISEKLRADPDRRVRIEQREQAIEAELSIDKLHEEHGATQKSVADKMIVTLSNFQAEYINRMIFLCQAT